MSIILSIFLLQPILSASTKPNGKPLHTATAHHFHYCTRSSPCSLGQGDCDSDYECQGRLTCGHSQASGKHGTNSCKEYNTGAHLLADCCVPPLYNLPVSVHSVASMEKEKKIKNPIKTSNCFHPTAPKHGEWFCSEAIFKRSSCSLECEEGYVPLGRSKVTCEEGEWTGEPSEMLCDEAAVMVAGGYSIGPMKMDSSVEVHFSNGSKIRLPDHPSPQKEFSIDIVDGIIIYCGDGKHYKYENDNPYVERGHSCWKMTQHFGWQPYREPLQGPCGHSAVSVFGALYLVGPGASSVYGQAFRHCSNNTSGKIEMIEPEGGNQWTVTELFQDNIGRRGCVIKVSGDTFLTMGGQTSPSSFPTAVVAHNIFNQTQRKVSEMPFSLIDMGFVYFEKDSERFVIIAGGSNESGSYTAATMAFNLNTFTWITYGDLLKPIVGVKLAVMDGTIFAFGGSDEKSSASDLIQKFNWQTKLWAKAGQLMTPRNYPAITQVPVSVFESMKIASKEDLKNIIGAEWIKMHEVTEEDKKTKFIDTFKFSVGSSDSNTRDKLKNIFSTMTDRFGTLAEEDRKFLESLHTLCRVKSLTNYPGYEIILPGEIAEYGNCEVNFEGKIFVVGGVIANHYTEVLVPGLDVLIWLNITENTLPKGLVKGGSKKGQTVYICKSNDFHKIGHAYMKLGEIWCSISDTQNNSLIIGVPNFSLLTVDGDDVTDELEYGEHPNEFVRDLEEMNTNTLLKTWQLEQIQKLFRYVEIDQETKTFAIPDGWEIVDINMDNFDKYKEKFSEPLPTPDKMPKFLLNMEIFSYWYGDGEESLMAYLNHSFDILMEYYYNSLQMGTGKFIMKTKKKCGENDSPKESKDNYPGNEDELQNEYERNTNENYFENEKRALARAVKEWNKCT